MPEGLEVADVIRRFGADWRAAQGNHLDRRRRRVVQAKVSLINQVRGLLRPFGAWWFVQIGARALRSEWPNWRRVTRKSSFIAASSVGKCPRARTACAAAWKSRPPEGVIGVQN